MSESGPSGGAVPRRTPRWMRVALVTSLALNLLTIGLIVSAAWHLRQSAGGFGLHGRLLGFAATLPEERSSAIGGLLRQAQPTLRPLRQEAWRARREAARAFAAEPFDQARFLAAHARLLATELEMRRAYARLISDVGLRLSAAERRAFLRWHAPQRRWSSKQNQEVDWGPGGQPATDESVQR